MKIIPFAFLFLAIPFSCLPAERETRICVNGSGNLREKLEDIVSCTAGGMRLSNFSFSSNAKGLKLSGGGDEGFGPGFKFTGRMRVGDSNSATWRFQYLVTITTTAFLMDAARLVVGNGDWKSGTGALFKYLCVGGAFETALESGSCSGTLHTLTMNPARESMATATFAGVTSFWVLDVVSLNSQGKEMKVEWVQNQFRRIQVP
jgi:hypothetical protein